MDNEKNGMTPETGELANELAYRRYLLNKDQARRLFKELSMPEYIALHIIEQSEETEGLYAGRTYLKDLAQRLQIPIRRTSDMVGELRDRGLLLWSHDGDGSEGTYVTLTESGRKLLSQEGDRLKAYYGKVIGSFGRDNLLQLLQLMKQLETVMSAEIESFEGSMTDGEEDE